MKNNIGSNMTDVKIKNRSLILELLKKKNISRRDIAKEIGLTPAAVTILTNEMIREGILKERGSEDENRVGRKSIFLSLNDKYKYAIGVNIGTERISVGLGSLSYELLDYREFKVKDINKSDIFDKIFVYIKELIWDNCITKDSILGIGVGIVGTVDQVNGISKKAYKLWNESINIKELFENTLGIKTIVENNVRAMTLAEIEKKRDCIIDNTVFVKYGPGIGSAIVLNNELYYGSNNNAGEIGHSMLAIEGELCTCGQRGCLEMIASPRSIVQKSLNISDKYMEIKNILQAYDEENTDIVNIINNALKYLSIGFVNIIQLYDPKKVIVYGELFRNKKVLDAFRGFIYETTSNREFSNCIELSLINENKSIGGIALALKRLFYSKGGM